MKHAKDIRVELTDNEIVSISKTKFEQWQRHREVIDFHTTELYDSGKITSKEVDVIRNIMKKASDRV